MSLLILLTIFLATSPAESPATPELRRSPGSTRLTSTGQTVETDGRTFATSQVTLQRVREPRVDPNAVYMSVGPMGADAPQPPSQSAGMTLRMEPPRRRLRVTISTAERVVLLTIDDILTGRADSRSLLAQYRFNPYFGDGADGLWEAMRSAPRVLGPDPAGDAITWLSPSSFAWATRSDTLVLDQRSDSLFTVTLRPRIR